ncbi:MAG: TolC family protein [Bacteroidia bacterium]|nr:TolC family protein [Bacteroidia bacterium]MDW8158910.1 TolC family protein [Bacteroidia bacterium]
MKLKNLLIFGLVIFFSLLHAQDTLKLSRQAYEAIFLKENLLLLAEKLEIPKAEALVLQARLWPNPALLIDEINLWATPTQISQFGEELPPLVGSSGRNQQVALSIEQLIYTAGKRTKNISLQKIGVQQARQQFEQLLRTLKLEFRKQLIYLQYLQLIEALYQKKLSSVKQLTQAYQKQVELGNIPRGDYIRLRALELKITKELSEYYQKANEVQKELKILMRLPSNTYLVLVEEGFLPNTIPYKNLVLDSLFQIAQNNRADLKLLELNKAHYQTLYELEKAMRIPNLTVKGSYDRGGNFMYNFIGFGVGMELPFFNRNQGNIEVAKVSIMQSELQHQQKLQTIYNEIALAYNNLQLAIQFLEKIEPTYESTLDRLLNSYTQNFLNRNISLLEYLDFSEAYLENKTIILEAIKELNEKIQNLNYSLGIDLLP